MSNEVLKELSQHYNWNPDDKDIPPVIEIDKRKCLHVVKRYMMDTLNQDQLDSLTGGTCTVYGAIKDQPLGNLLLYVDGTITFEDLLNSNQQGIQPNRTRPLALDKGKEWVEAVRETSRKIYNLREGLVDIDTPDTTDTVDVDELKKQLDDALALARKATGEEKKLKEEVDKLKEVSRKLASAPKATVPTEVAGDGSIPNGKTVFKSIRDVFPKVKFPDGADFEVTTWEWDGPHPDVPNVDPHYIFRPKELLRVLYAACTDSRLYLHGDYGSGKTSLLLQVAAALGQPVKTINFNRQIDLNGLLGKTEMRKGGETYYKDGVLPKYMPQPYWLVCDEIDFIEPELAYAMQAPTEGRPLVITDDGGRVVNANPLFRMFVTGNTVGQGDEKGMYQGAQPQSLAFLDRFTVWCHVPQLDKRNRRKLIEAHQPTLTGDELEVILAYVDEHLTAFDKGSIIQPISARGYLAVAQAVAMMGDVKMALEMSVLDKANGEDYAVLKGIIDRVVA